MLDGYDVKASAPRLMALAAREARIKTLILSK
jgi:hypothetical protein